MADVLARAAAAARQPGARLYLRPTALLAWAEAAVADGEAIRLAGGAVASRAVELIVRGDDVVRAILAYPALDRWAADQPEAVAARVGGLLHRLSAPRAAFAGLDLGRPRLMGIVNVTPDSFSDGGAALDPGLAVERMASLAAAGADILDIGAESTRPGAAPVAAATEAARLRPVLTRWAGRAGPPLSIDTRRAATMRLALDCGARILNDVSALTDDPESLAVAAGSPAGVVLMHKQGQPATMNLAPRYAVPALEVYDYLEARVAACEAAGIGRDRILVDPGVAFGKSTLHSLEILRSLALYHGLGCGILVGVSRKGLVGRRDGDLEPSRRLSGSLAATLAAFDRGVQVTRVHDVAETALARAVWEALMDPGWRDALEEPPPAA